MARRRRLQDDYENVDRWLVSYADFMTLLFAFFVVMYAISSVNEGKYRVLSDTLVAAFNTPPKSPTPIQLGDEAKSPKLQVKEGQARATKIVPVYNSNKVELQRIAEDVNYALKPLIDKNLINVEQTDEWVKIEMNTRILYTSGSAELEDEAYPLLRDLARILKDLPNQIEVEGHTDNLPINTPLYPSNWELSASRAASVVHVFMKSGISPQQLKAIGFSEYQPAADNKTLAGRRRNRRVVVTIRPVLDDQRTEDTNQILEPAPLPEAIPVEKEIPAIQRIEVEKKAPVPLKAPSKEEPAESNPISDIISEILSLQSGDDEGEKK